MLLNQINKHNSTANPKQRHTKTPKIQRTRNLLFHLTKIQHTTWGQFAVLEQPFCSSTTAFCWRQCKCSGFNSMQILCCTDVETPVMHPFPKPHFSQGASVSFTAPASKLCYGHCSNPPPCKIANGQNSSWSWGCRVFLFSFQIAILTMCYLQTTFLPTPFPTSMLSYIALIICACIYIYML